MDPGAEIEAAIWALLVARPGLAAGCKPGNRIRPSVDFSAMIRAAIHRMPGDYLEIKLDPRDDLQRFTSTPTLGLAAAVANCDAIIPTRHTFDLTCSWDPAVWAKKFPAAASPEAEAVAALNAAYPKLGLSWVRSFEITGTWQSPSERQAARMRNVKRISVEARPHLSQLQ